MSVVRNTTIKARRLEAYMIRRNTAEKKWNVVQTLSHAMLQNEMVNDRAADPAQPTDAASAHNSEPIWLRCRSKWNCTLFCIFFSISYNLTKLEHRQRDQTNNNYLLLALKWLKQKFTYTKERLRKVIKEKRKYAPSKYSVKKSPNWKRKTGSDVSKMVAPEL